MTSWYPVFLHTLHRIEDWNWSQNVETRKVEYFRLLMRRRNVSLWSNERCVIVSFLFLAYAFPNLLCVLVYYIQSSFIIVLSGVWMPFLSSCDKVAPSHSEVYRHCLFFELSYETHFNIRFWSILFIVICIPVCYLCYRRGKRFSNFVLVTTKQDYGFRPW